jgi:hypothetical protein
VAGSSALPRPAKSPHSASATFEKRNQPSFAASHLEIAAMQTNQLPLASGIPRLSQIAPRCVAATKKGTKMSKTTSANFAPSTGIFSRLMASIDRLLASSARIAVRNGDLPYFGL